MKAGDLAWGGGAGDSCCQGEGRDPSAATDPSSSPTGLSRAKEELQKILDMKGHTSISEAKAREDKTKER